MKSGMQMMFESMIGAEGAKAIEECKRILPSVPILIEHIKAQWIASQQRAERMERLLERVATQNNLILGKLEAVEMSVDSTKTTETPFALMAALSDPKDATEILALTERMESQLGSDGNGNSNQ